MSEELIQRNLIMAPETMGTWKYYNIGSTSLKTLKEARIIPNRDYEEFEKKKPDALVIKKPLIVAAIEYKSPKELRTRNQIDAAISHQLGTARALGAKVYIVTDGNKTFWLNPLTGNEIKLEDGSRIAVTFNKNDIECVKLINKIIASINDTNDALLMTAVVDPLPLAQKVWQDLWSVSGATPENCLYTFVELFIFKYLSDLGVLTGLHSFPNLLNQYKTNSDGEVLEYYANTIRKKIKELFPLNPKDNTTIINGTIFISKDDIAVSGYATVFRKILERFDSFVTLENIDYDFKSKLFETFLKESISKKNWGQFFTPLKVVRAIVSMADISMGMKICDPFCGVGKFLLEPILHEINRYFLVENGELKPQITLSGFDKGFDKDEQKTIILAKANMLIYMSSLVREHSDITKQFAELFNDTFLLQTNSILGTLANPVVNEYDLILTNPPYVMSGSSNLKDEIAKRTPEEVINKQKSLLEQHYAVSAMGVEGLSMEWIIHALKPGGKAFIVVPDGIMNRSNDKRLRDFILEECIIDAVISLPLNTFFTTNKKTYIVALTKKTPISSDGIVAKERQATPVFTYLCSEIGESRDVYRFDIPQNDLDTAATLYNAFKGVRGAIPFDDKRCKIVNIDSFYDSTHWSIERWWTREEKIELGIEDENISTDINQFVSMITDTASAITAYQEPLLDLTVDLSNYTMRDFVLGELLNPIKGKSKYTKKYGDTNKGDYPVYSASANKPLTYIDTFDYNGDYLSWSTNGFAGTVTVLSEKFSINGDRGILLPKHDDVDIQYLRYVLQPIFRRLAKGRKGDRGTDEFTKLYPSMILDVKVPIPVGNDGKISLEEQKEIAKIYALIERCKREILDKLNLLLEQKISF